MGVSTPSWSIETPLWQIARDRGLRFGAAIGRKGMGDEAYRTLIAEQCGIIVCENEMKWRQLRPKGARYNFGMADRIVAFAQKNRMAMRGHALLFHRSLTETWQQSVDEKGPEKAVEDHITTVVEHFAGAISSWDVVNEPIDPNSERTDRLRDSAFLKEIGPKYIDLAFHVARQVAPEATLVLNDWVAPYRPKFFDDHRVAMLGLLERLKKSNVPVDALGVQGHLVTSRTDFDEKAWSAFLGEVSSMGIGILVTELDAADSDLPVDQRERDHLVADHTRRFLDVTLANERVSDVLSWGLSDKYSAVHLNHPRKDGLPNRSLPYDDQYAEKPLRTAIAMALSNAPKRQMTGKNYGE